MFRTLGRCVEAPGSITSICDQRWGQYWGSLHTHLGKYLHMGRGLVGQLCPSTGLASSEGLMSIGNQTRSHVGLQRCGLGYKDLGAHQHRATECRFQGPWGDPLVSGGDQGVSILCLVNLRSRAPEGS